MSTKEVVNELCKRIDAPAVDSIIKYWSYREWQDAGNNRRSAKLLTIDCMNGTFSRDEDTKHKYELLKSYVYDLKHQFAELYRPGCDYPIVHNHSGFEVRLEDGRRAMFHFSDWNLYIYQLIDEDFSVAKTVYANSHNF